MTETEVRPAPRAATNAPPRDRLRFFRRLCLIFAVLTLGGMTLGVVFGDEAPPQQRLLVVASASTLVALWLLAYRRQRISSLWLPVEGVLLMVVAPLLGGSPNMLGVLYTGVQYRALYGTRLDAVFTGGTYMAACLVAMQLLPRTPDSPHVTALLGLGFNTFLLHTLAEVVTRDAHARQVLRNSEQWYRGLFDNNPWPVWVYDPATLGILDVNSSAVEQYGYSRQEYLAMRMTDLTPNGQAGAPPASSGTSQGDARKTQRLRHRMRDGRVIDVEVTEHDIQFEDRLARLALAVDVTERAHAERQLQESESRFRSVVDCLTEAVLIADTEETIVLANARVRDVFGYEPHEVIGRKAADLLLPPLERDAFRKRLRRRLEGVSEVYEVQLVRKDGTRITAEIAGSPYRDVSGSIIGTLGAISDVTERKRLEARVQQSSRLEAVGQLAGGVAHDFNNLLTVIKVHAELLRDELAHSHPLLHSVREIEGAANRAADVTAQLLAFSRRQLLQPRRLSLDHAVTEALPVLRKLAGRRVELATSTDASTPSVFADPLQIENVLVTLVRNACEAMPRGGRIVIGTESRDMGARDLAFQSQHLPAGRYTVLWVSDTGTGMDASVLRRLFEPFFTTKEVGSGSGMGLASMFGIVRQSGGFVDVESAPGTGTTFTLYLPAIVDHASPPAEAVTT